MKYATEQVIKVLNNLNPSALSKFLLANKVWVYK